jgi:hypothetical protein
MRYRPTLTQELLKRFVFYDPSSGIFKRTHVLDRSQNIKRKDFIPKSVTLNGYLQISLFKTPYLVHRLIFLYMVGRFPSEVDHVDGNRLNNRWENLREVTNAINRKNMGVAVNNTSGVTGVSWYQRYGKWEASINIGRQRKYLGRFYDINDAISARKEAELSLGFHPNHGERPSWRG